MNTRESQRNADDDDAHDDNNNNNRLIKTKKKNKNNNNDGGGKKSQVPAFTSLTFDFEFCLSGPDFVAPKNGHRHTRAPVC